MIDQDNVVEIECKRGHKILKEFNSLRSKDHLFHRRL